MSGLFKRLTLALLLTAGLCAEVGAWRDTGHYMVALIAYRQLDGETRQPLVATLRQHPRFEADFADRMPRKVAEADQATRDLWIFLQAATWPDIARDFDGEERKKYHHGNWHYVNFSLFLSRRDSVALAGEKLDNTDPQWRPGMQARQMNILQALHKSTSLLKAQRADRAERAVYLCWLLHLAGDLHQPMHATALYAAEAFPKGDRGGNLIPVKNHRNLHALWDGLPGRTRSLPVLESRVSALLADAALAKTGRRAVAEMDFSVWAEESRRTAWDYAYSAALIETLYRAQGELEPVEFSEDELEVMRTIAGERIIQAGFRMAELLRRITRP